MIIGINGKIGSGKDTVGKIIQYLTLDEAFSKTNKDILADLEYDGYCANKSSWEIKKFAGKLKQIASLLTGIPIEKFEDQEFKKTYLGEEWNSPYNIPFSGPDFVEHDGAMTVRTLLQKLGTEAMRDNLHENVWVNALFADYKPFGKTFKDVSPVTGVVTFDTVGLFPNWIITDMRFPNEMEAVKERKGITIRVVRPLNSKSEPIISAIHPSETALDDAEFDYEIINDGTIEDLIERVKEILIKEDLL